MIEYTDRSALFKVLGEPIRLQILDILSGGEMCACDILQQLSISQPTLSHHMKALAATGWVNVRRKATWMHYSLNRDNIDKLHQFLIELTTPKETVVSRVSCTTCDCCEENQHEA